MNQFELVVFDVDEILVKSSRWQNLHETLGIWNRGKKYLKPFFHGNIADEEWMCLDAALWRGQPLERIRQNVSCVCTDVVVKSKDLHHILPHVLNRQHLSCAINLKNRNRRGYPSQV